MMVKIDTREKYHLIRLPESVDAANLTDVIGGEILPLLQGKIRNLVISLQQTKVIDEGAVRALEDLATRTRQARASFVCCTASAPIRELWKRLGAELPYAPTESEASDIVFMEEIERELGAGES